MELTGSVPLPALEPDWAREVRADPRLLDDVAHAVAGPFHVLHPDTFAHNLAGFHQALRQAGVDGQVFYGKKANKGACFLHACAENGAGVDVASEHELADCLAHGVRGDEIVVTGAAKRTDLLWLAARHGSLVAVDALDELERVVELARRTGRIRVLLRVLPEVNPRSRFGFNPAELDRAIQRCTEERDLLRMEGFSFHLNGYEVAPRAQLAAELVDRCADARAKGLPAEQISIGGGFAVNYVDGEDWKRFHDEYRDAWFHNDKAFSHFYPYHQAPTGADMLAAILGSPDAEHGTVGAKFAATATRMLMEPGRALLDGAGFTAFPVQGFKWRGDYGIVTAQGLSLSLSEQWKNSEYLPDPLLWSPDGAGDGELTPACVGGASCLEYDMLTWRKVPFPRAPRFGDLLVYPNTAGYQMDKNESEFHQIPLPTRVVVSRENNRLRWKPDRGT